jgi:hypothetical protein
MYSVKDKIELENISIEKKKITSDINQLLSIKDDSENEWILKTRKFKVINSKAAKNFDISKVNQKLEPYIFATVSPSWAIYLKNTTSKVVEKDNLNLF